MTSDAATPARLPTSRLLRIGAIAILAAEVANIVARFLIGLVIPLSPDFQPFSYGAIIFFTFLFCLLGLVVFALVNRFAANPLKVFNIIALVAFVLVSIPNLLAAANPATMPMGGTGSDYLILLVFHAVAAGAFLGVLNFLARPER